MEEAVECFSHSQKLRLDELGPFHPSVSFSMTDLAMAREEMGDKHESEKLFLSAITSLSAKGGAARDVADLKAFLAKKTVRHKRVL